MLPNNEVVIVNDLHLGVQRLAGTTPASAQALQDYLQRSFEGFVKTLANDAVLVINGDVFDGFSVPLGAVSQFVNTVRNWMDEAKERRLVLSRGNHDISKDSTKLSSFDFAGQMLCLMFPFRVTVVKEPTNLTQYGLYVVPHAPNQDIFDLWLEEVPPEVTVLLHANYDNNFAVESDHSLNVSEEQAERLVNQHCTLIFGHEHQARTLFGGRLLIPGNQWPSSIADCLGNSGGLKKALRLGASGVSEIVTWDAMNEFTECDWRDLEHVGSQAKFVRVIGNATGGEAVEAVSAIARLRRESDAFVISNAVTVEGSNSAAQSTAQSIEAVRGFDVLGFVLGKLSAGHREKLQQLLKETEPSNG